MSDHKGHQQHGQKKPSLQLPPKAKQESKEEPKEELKEESKPVMPTEVPEETPPVVEEPKSPPVPELASTPEPAPAPEPAAAPEPPAPASLPKFSPPKSSSRATMSAATLEDQIERVCYEHLKIVAKYPAGTCRLVDFHESVADMPKEQVKHVLQAYVENGYLARTWRKAAGRYSLTASGTAKLADLEARYNK